MRTIYKLSYRIILSLLTLLTPAIAFSAEKWDGTSVSASLNGEGTIERPYEIASGADLKKLQSDPSLWVDGIYILQIDDIDLDGHELGIIGYGDGTKTGADIHSTSYKPFFATYDGGAHKISNLRINWDIKKTGENWDTKDEYHHSAGLFGLLAGTVRNLHIHHAVVTRNPGAVAAHNKCDMRLGVIAGAAAPNKKGNKQVKIENIIITKSEINDGGVATDLKTYFFGGVVGDVSCGFGGTNTISASNYGYVYIRNIYAQVDFDLSNTVRTIQDQGSITQFDVGGIVGRMRRGKYSDLPVDIVYTGKVKAPLAAIAPSICMSRCNGNNNAVGMNDAYTGEVNTPINTASTSAFVKLASDEVKVGAEWQHPNENRFFCNYQIWDSQIGDYVEITNAYPTIDENRGCLRTLDKDGSKLTVNAPTEMMRSWQGVNHGSYINLQTNIGANTATTRLNSLNDPVKFAWNADSVQFEFSASENVNLTRNSLHTISAVIYNDNRTTDYIYSWKLTDCDGNEHTFETTKSTAASYVNDNVGFDVNLNTCKLTIKNDFRNYVKASMTLYDEMGHSLASAEIDLPDFGLTFKRSTEKTDKVRYHFSPEFNYGEEELSAVAPLLAGSNLTYSWSAYKWNGSAWVEDNEAIYSGATSPEVVVKQEFIGSVRLVVTDNEILGHPYTLTSHIEDEVEVAYMEQKLERLRLSFTIKQMQLNASGDSIGTEDFNPSKYFTGSKGYDVTYSYDEGNTSGFLITSEDGVEHHLSATNAKGTLRDTNTPPLIFEGTVVDQFGNIVDYDSEKYRIQWSFRIPDSRETKTFPDGLDWDSSTGYVRANGVYPTISADTVGSGIDWVGDYYCGRGNTTSQFACDRWGEYAVKNYTTFKIHPNLLHCTSTFDVRAMLYDISDPENPTAVETVVSFSQVDIDTEKVDGGYKAIVRWRSENAEGNAVDYTSSSLYSFKWYSNPDPTDCDGWTLVEGAGADYITYGWPNDSIKGIRERFSTITGVDSALFYKVEFATASGTFIEGIMGPENVIFVYDRAKTLENPNFHDFDFYDVQTNYYFPQGDDTNHGRDPWHAVATMSQAFKLLDKNGTYKTNRIVVMGFYYEYKGSTQRDYFMHDTWWAKNEAKPTTISGAYGAHIKGGTLGLGYDSSTAPFDVYLQKPMRWDHLTLFTYNTNNSNQNCIYANNHDFIIGKDVRLTNFYPLSTASGLAAGVNVPNFTIVAGHYDFMSSKTAWTDPIAEMDGAHKLNYDGNEIEGVTTIKINSGGFGRIIGASRNSGNANSHVPALFGTPKNPNRVRIEIDIKHEAGKEKEYLPDWYVVRPDGTLVGAAEFSHDLGIVVGGQTDGSTFSDTEITIRNAHVARYVSGNITFGRPVTTYSPTYVLPDDAYYGRTVLNIYGGVFDEIYGGSLGRTGSSGNIMVKAFFYGQSVINMYDGVIGDSKHPTDAKVFAAGAGGVIGKGYLWNVDGRLPADERKTYTVDDRIPFLKTDGSIEFRAFDEGNPNARMPIMKCVDSEGNSYDLDLTDSRVELNLYGGTIYGNVYGGGYGYASNLTVETVPYRVLTNTKELQGLAGNVYGTSYVRLLPNPDPTRSNVVIYGDVYGSGAGDNRYIDASATKSRVIDEETYTYNFTEIAKTFGDTYVIINAGQVKGDVYGGGCGIEKYGEMANIYGDAHMEITGGSIEGNIYGGAAFSDIRKYSFTNAAAATEYGGGNTHLSISGGTLGNCIFGGGKGKFVSAGSEQNAASNIYGDAFVEISGGSFSEEPYLITTLGQTSKPFNIYGGGYINGTIKGNTHVLIRKSPLMSNESIDRDFSEAWNDILDRRFCVYGAGYGELTRVGGNTFVDINIEPTAESVLPSLKDIDQLIPGQTIFDVAGGGYSGNTGYWEDSSNNALYKQDHPDVGSYDHYVGGELNVTVKGYPFIRKVIGGSFYAECNNTNTYIETGSIKEVYGGALMGYVHDHARLNIGSKAVNGTLANGFDAIAITDAATASERNSHLFITGNVYGGNDVKGIVGTTFWTNDVPGAKFGMRGAESSDGAPLFCADVSQALNKGVTLYIHGGTIGGNVYGAGNGHYRGYYVPDWVRYNDGPERHYRTVCLVSDGSGETKYGKVYRCRPMTGSVTMHVGGNSETDRVRINGNLYGGGRSCTIGQWNTILPYEDPRRLVKAGFLHVNFGSHVNVNSVYMGAQGDDFVRPKELFKSGLTIGDGEIPSTLDLDSIGDIAYDHWYLTADGSRYMPGFPPPGEVDGNYGMLGAHMLRAYAKNIEMNADIELTFYSNPFKLNPDNTPVMSADGTTVLCKKWLPAEKAHTDYDSNDLTFTNFFGGGASGFMTNNKLMRYNYTTGEPVPDISYDYYKNAAGTEYGVNYDLHAGGAEIEKFGTIYRYSLPPGLTVLDKVVGGSEDAIGFAYEYTVNPDETITLTDDKYYTFEGGMVTQCSYTYDLIVHNDKYFSGYHNNLDHAIPAEHFAHHAEYGDEYILQHGPDAGRKIYRWHIPEKSINPNSADITDSRYDLAYYYDDSDVSKTTKLAYCGPRESRIEGNKTVLKLTVASQFDPQAGEVDPGSLGTGDDHESHYGGVIYGGCYNSGVTQGDVMVSVSSNTIGAHQDVSNPESFGQISSLAHNVGRVFGGGYGPNSRVDGDTYVNLMLGFVGMNVFGGGCRGNVNGTTHVKYVGNEDDSYILGAIYGGSLYGSVGVPGQTPIATDVRLYSGNVDKVYGGSCLGDLYGRTNVELCDEVTTELEYFDYQNLLDNDDIDDWGGSRLIVGSAFGGNDIAGRITPQPTTVNPEDPEYDAKNLCATYIRTYEMPHDVSGLSDGSGGDASSSATGGPGKQSPGSVGAYNGYPLIGYLYAGSNGNYGTHGVVGGKDIYVDEDSEHPTVINFATGEGNATMKLKLGGQESSGSGASAVPGYSAFEVPNVTHARLDIEGGTIVNAYGGGDRATVTEKTEINVRYLHDTDIMDARAGFVSDAEFVRTWNTCHLSHTDQIDEVTYMRENGDGGSDRVFRYHVYRLFGGNDKDTMTIQPTWNLESGHLGSVYSGGNFGTMTYFSRDAMGKPQGLALKVDSPHFHADAIYGGGRVGDINPAVDAAFIAKQEEYATTPSKENEVYGFYGATLDVRQGVIDHVYGGNDVSGNVKYGTSVVISGAISGDVYCAGNGNYLYKYDPEYTGSEIQEIFDKDYGRYFRLPMDEAYGADEPKDVERVLAINRYRPNVDRSFLHIEGTRDPDGLDSKGNPVKGDIHYAYVRGNVYCGGNSSTVGVGVDDNCSIDGITFDIGKYVMLNGVFLGSNGENLVDPSTMGAFESLNKINLANPTQTFPDSYLATHYNTGYAKHDREVVTDNGLFPCLLDVYMRAVDVYSTPSDFQMAPANIDESYIGDFYVGGNRGSMLTDKTISLTFPHELVIFGKIVGGSNNANVTYKGVKHIGGLTRAVKTAVGEKEPDKVYLQVLSQFQPWKMTYPAKNKLGETDYRVIKVVPDVDKVDENLYFPESKCSVFGGCFNSGRTIGNIHIDLYSDLSGEYDPATNIYKQIDSLYHIGTGATDVTKERIIINGIDKLQRRSFAIIGGGYGSATSVLGNIRLHMLPGKFHPSFVAGHNESPSAATIFAGSEKGDVIGNTEITVRDGVVLSNLYGGSESSTLYGSTNIIIGWPQYFICNKTGRYALKRTDTISKGAHYVIGLGSKEPEPVKKEIWLCEGDYMSVNLYRQIDAAESGLTHCAPTLANPYGDLEDDGGNKAFKYVSDDTPEKYAAHNNSPYVEFHDITWDDINIYIGNNKSRLSDRAEYYAHGNIYGGGFITANSGTTLAGEYTVRKFDEEHTPSASLIGYGGNSTILIWDNPDNADTNNPVGGRVRKKVGDGLEAEGTGAIVRDHITIGTGHYKEVNLGEGQDAMGYYVFEEDPSGRYELNGNRGKYVHQSSHIIQHGETTKYYEIESDGGIYGGGRKVYVEGFRNCDLAYYGYADYTPQYPKLLNTAQRLDLFTISDCCLMMQGAVDFASNSIDATRYSMTRIGELEMRSSINPNISLSPGVRDNTALANVIHDQPRVRNYMAFFHDVLYVSAMTSSESFTNNYRGANGQLGYIGNFTKTGTDSSDHSAPAGSDYAPLDYASTPFSYKQYKANRIGNYYANRNRPNKVTVDDGHGGTTEIDNPIKLLTTLEFDQRNVGTAANMIGINNGYTLKIQGATVNTMGQDEVYYGPVNGVFEVKLMTLATDEGGGYIYALNQHDDPNHFMQTTGNFVFPGAAYRKSSQKKSSIRSKIDGGEGSSEEDYNYVYDDCFPMGKGWDSYWGWNSTDEDETTSSMGPNLHIDNPTTAALDSGANADCDDPEHDGQEVHFWYVNGSNFYFNVTLTAYTYKDPQFFHLNNNEDLIYLYGINNTSNISLESATWTPLSEINTGGYVSDLRNLEDLPDDYQLFLSIDDKPEQDHTVGADLGNRPVGDSESFVTRIPRANLLTDGTTDDLTYDVAETRKNYASGSPLLGITLYDKCDNAAKGYYESHLSKDEKVRLVLKAKDADDLTFQYTINLTVKYVKGPTIDGHLQIENDALPGEYIYANAYGVNIDIDDENMGINARNWYIVGKECDIMSNTSIKNYIDGIEHGTTQAASVNDQLIGTTDRRQVHIPAYRYRDGWNVVYEIKANGLSFFVVPDTTSSGALGSGEHKYKCLNVHNYHRMKPMVPMSASTEDLHLSEGAWIYIEDDDDMTYFYDWLGELQAEDCATTLSGDIVINPRYASGLTVQLMGDVKMPADKAAQDLRFDGIFHGNGHNIDMGSNKFFLGDNHGAFYNTGFTSSLTSADGASVFKRNSGQIDCCFFYNTASENKGRMLYDALSTGDMANCYTTSALDAERYPSGISYASADEFRYGSVAYNLNRFYLQERYIRHVTATHADSMAVEPIKAKFYDGEYRYGAVHSDQFPFLLRTAAVPNYRDYLGLRINATPDEVASGAVLGTMATMHDVTEPVDSARLVKVGVENHYEPLFESDYLFFGQDLTYGTSDRYPHAAYASTRVYRASGFYGSKVDEGFYFNDNVQALNPALTAVDFSGVRDAQHGNLYYAGRKELKDASGKMDQKVWFAPQLDLPNLSACAFDVGSRLQKAHLGSIPEIHISRNLLVYREEGAYDGLSDFLYNTSTPYEDVYCHVVDVPDPNNLATEPAYVNYVQLVDKEDYNAPIAFDVKKAIWYRRLPAGWANNGDGWEGLCLPFTANITYGSVASRELDSYKNHGLMTHFYGKLEDDKPDDGDAYWTRQTHEYWLRKFTGIEGAKAYFDRPASKADEEASNPVDNLYSSYHFSNEYFMSAYGDLRYDEVGTKHVPAAYTSAGTDYADYPLITANYPYLVSFPGERYYEFDCSGQFYSDRTGDGTADPQIMTFAWTKAKAEVGNDEMHIAVSDDSKMVFAHAGKKFVGTFMRCKATTNDAVVEIDGTGAHLVRPGSAEEKEVLPFRAYLQGTSSSGMPMLICSRGIDAIGDDDVQPEDEPGDEIADVSLQIYLDGRVLVVENPYDYNLNIPLCDVAGRVLRVLEIVPGCNRYGDLYQGFYLLNSFKFYIP